MNTALITGCNGILGQATVKEFLKNGYPVLGIDRGKGTDTSGKGLNIEHLDLINETEVKKAIQRLHQQSPIRFGVMIAGGFGMGGILESPMDEVQKMIDLNFKTAYHVARPLFATFKENGGGKMIFIASKPAVETGGSFAMAYSLSKSMLVKLTEMINEEGKANDISATAIAPEIIDTPVNREAMPNANYDQWVKPEEIARNILHLCTDGQVITENVIRLYNKN